MPKLRLTTFAMLLAPLLAACVLALYLAGALPYRVYVVHTGSMSPTIPSRSAVLVHEGRFHLGQVVTFREHGATVTHRLVAANRDGTFDTKGDANRTIDPWRIRRADIIGGVVAAPHFVGYALVYLKLPAGAASVLLAILAVWQAAALTRRRRPAAAATRLR